MGRVSIVATAVQILLLRHGRRPEPLFQDSNACLMLGEIRAQPAMAAAPALLRLLLDARRPRPRHLCSLKCTSVDRGPEIRGEGGHRCSRCYAPALSPCS